MGNRDGQVAVSLEGASKSFVTATGAVYTAVADISLRVEEGT